jgi:sortase A
MECKKQKNGTQRSCGSLLMPLLAVLLFLTGVGIFLYPSISNYFAEREHTSVIHEYQAQIDAVDSTDLEAELEKAETYNESLAGDPVGDPFIPGSGYALPENYEEVLNVNGDGVMGYLEIPKIGVLLPIYHGTSDDVLEKGVGHIESTALPIGGSSRHAVLTGHRGLPSAELFTRLDELEIGDIFYIHVLGETLAYEVDQIKTVLPTELDDLQAVSGEDLVTLLTCTPYGVNTQRLLVRGCRTDYVQETEGTEATQEQSSGFRLQLSIAGVVIGAVLLAVILLFLKCRKRGRHER